ncbi:MAG: hypothetical protein AAB448_03940, partial [Patescibacteria group bacterium]
MYAEQTQAILHKLEALHLSKEREDFFRLMEILREWQQIYFQTEAVRLEKFKNETDRNILADLENVARCRLKLRTSAEEILFEQMYLALKRVAEARSLKVNDLFFYTLSEMEDLMQHGNKVVHGRRVEERKKGYAFWRDNTDGHLEVGKRAQRIAETVDGLFLPKGVTEFCGTVANRGKVRGEVQLILHDQPDNDIHVQVNRFHAGQILVTEMTR